MRSNKQRLGDEISGRMVRTAAASVQTCVELGVIGAGLTLTTDSIKSAIPKDQYMVDIRLAAGSYNTSTTTNTSTITHESWTHSHRLPSSFRCLNVGDRVLVVWAGNDPVIVAIVCSGSKLN